MNWVMMEILHSNSVTTLLFSPVLSKGRAGSTWRARAVFRTRSQCVPQMTPTRWPGSACLRWRKTSGAAQPLRSSQGQVSLNGCFYLCYTSYLSNLILPSICKLCRDQGQITEVFYVPLKLQIHRFLPSRPADNCHMVWKLSHNWSKTLGCNYSCQGMPLFLLIFPSFWPDCSGTVPACLLAPLMWLSLSEVCTNKAPAGWMKFGLRV